MSDYDPTVNPGDTRLRIWKIQGSNALSKLPTLFFYEEEAIKTSAGDDQTLSSARDILQVSYDPASDIPVRNPETDELTGEVDSQGRLYQLLYSLGRLAQTNRDESSQA